MLEPREADIPALFLVLVVLPLVTYFLLGKWHEAAKKNERLKMLAQLAAEEALRAGVASVSEFPSESSSKNSLHECARCLSPATTRCARCKSVRYCSGKCQIIHWRQGHKHECQQLDNSNSVSSTNPDPISRSSTPRISRSDDPSPTFFRYEYDIKEPVVDGAPSNISGRRSTTLTDKSQMFQVEQKLSDKRTHDGFKVDGEISRRKVTSSFHNVEKTIVNGPVARTVNITGPTSFLPSKEASTEQKVLNNEVGPYKSTMHGLRKLKCQNGSGFESGGPHMERNGINPFLDHHNVLREEGSRAIPCLQTEKKAQIESPYKIPPTSGSVTIPVQRSSDIMKIGDVKMIGSRKLLRLAMCAPAEDGSDSGKKTKALFPYEEFVKLFHYEGLEFSPRGLLNCGNSCYANAVLQCLTYTKPLIIYLLRRSHSGTCWMRDWCLMCELEQHVSNLTEGGGPLSLRSILSNMQNIGCQMGGGSQEDAHEFLRLLVTSMQSICLEGLGGEKEIDLRLQETTFIQQTFGGCLRSKVKCLRCQHESERYENIMDLTLEILGWVETLEDALTQFTAPEDLDGENMYRCGRCTSYVKARKQLSIHEAPNILTIVLKRFQTGKYGKINKCVTFPDLLDMIPFMTGTGDSPPLYMLYAVVVHLDTSNASFSGHYVSYVKDLQGTWFKIDDTEVEPVSLSQVMSEGAYILFYSRSFPRPPKVYCKTPTALQSPALAKSFTPNAQKSSRQRQCKPYSIHSASELSSPIYSTRIDSDPKAQSTNTDHFLSKRNILSPMETFPEPVSMEFSDFTSSDGSLFTSDGSRFTSSDEASFTTESNRDSISTVDYADSVTLDPVSSLFSTYYIPEYSHSSVSCTKFSCCRPQTRFFFKGRDVVLDSSMSGKPLDSVHKGRNPEQISSSLDEPLASTSNWYVCPIKR